jgi:hypothetical protein
MFYSGSISRPREPPPPQEEIRRSVPETSGDRDERKGGGIGQWVGEQSPQKLVDVAVAHSLQLLGVGNAHTV